MQQINNSLTPLQLDGWKMRSKEKQIGRETDKKKD